MRINKGPTVHTSRTHDQIIKTSDKCGSVNRDLTAYTG